MKFYLWWNKFSNEIVLSMEISKWGNHFFSFSIQIIKLVKRFFVGGFQFMSQLIPVPPVHCLKSYTSFPLGSLKNICITVFSLLVFFNLAGVQKRQTSLAQFPNKGFPWVLYSSLFRFIAELEDEFQLQPGLALWNVPPNPAPSQPAPGVGARSSSSPAAPAGNDLYFEPVS